MYRNGKWVTFETTICWLERDSAGSLQLTEKEATFSSISEREAHIKQVIAAGLLFDVKWITESNYGGEPGPNDKAIYGFIKELK